MKDYGGPAFPVSQDEQHRIGIGAIIGIDDPVERERKYIEATARAAAGMSLRDYAVIKITAALASHPGGWPDDPDWPEIVRRAALGADAIIDERNKNT